MSWPAGKRPRLGKNEAWVQLDLVGTLPKLLEFDAKQLFFFLIYIQTHQNFGGKIST